MTAHNRSSPSVIRPVSGGYDEHMSWSMTVAVVGIFSALVSAAAAIGAVLQARYARSQALSAAEQARSASVQLKLVHLQVKAAEEQLADSREQASIARALAAKELRPKLKANLAPTIKWQWFEDPREFGYVTFSITNDGPGYIYGLKIALEYEIQWFDGYYNLAAPDGILGESRLLISPGRPSSSLDSVWERSKLPEGENLEIGELAEFATRSFYFSPLPEKEPAREELQIISATVRVRGLTGDNFAHYWVLQVDCSALRQDRDEDKAT